MFTYRAILQLCTSACLQPIQQNSDLFRKDSLRICTNTARFAPNKSALPTPKNSTNQHTHKRVLIFWFLIWRIWTEWHGCRRLVCTWYIRDLFHWREETIMLMYISSWLLFVERSKHQQSLRNCPVLQQKSPREKSQLRDLVRLVFTNQQSNPCGVVAGQFKCGNPPPTSFVDFSSLPSLIPSQ